MFVQQVSVQLYTSPIMWRDFFPNAHIFGIDVNITLAESLLSNHDRSRISLLENNALDMDSVTAHLGNTTFDLVINDGLTYREGQVFFLDM